MIHVALMGEIVMSLHHPLLRLRLVSKAIQRLTAPKDLPMEFVIQWVIHLFRNQNPTHWKFMFKFRKVLLILNYLLKNVFSLFRNVIPMLVDWMEEIVNRQHHQMLTYLPLTHTYHHQVNQNMAVEKTQKNIIFMNIENILPSWTLENVPFFQKKAS